MSSYDRTYDPRRTIAAIFRDRAGALAAVTALQCAGFRSICLGAEDEPRERLRDALVRHGSNDDEAFRIDEMLAPGQVVVSVNAYDYRDAAATILIENGGIGVDPWGPGNGANAASRSSSLQKEE